MDRYFFGLTLLLLGQPYYMLQAQSPGHEITTNSSAATSVGPTIFTKGIPPSLSLHDRMIPKSWINDRTLSVSSESDMAHSTASQTPGTFTTSLKTDIVKNASWPATSPGNIGTTNHMAVGATPTIDSTTPQTMTPASESRSTGPVPKTATGKSAAVSVLPNSTTGTGPTQAPESSLGMLAFGVMSFILILIIVMVILVTAVNVRGQCNNSKSGGKKICDSVVSEGNITTNAEKENITLVSVRMISPETDTDSPQISSVHSTTLDNEDQELSKDLLNNKVV